MKTILTLDHAMFELPAGTNLTQLMKTLSGCRRLQYGGSLSYLRMSRSPTLKIESIPAHHIKDAKGKEDEL